ncbi:class I SAM-dependent methyltransferase [Thermus thermophilus]|uniref:Methylase involved in ubiquinone/menaquinone biosynthesis n=2 Tax=Thermus thermophilus TaxID=274 RepID=H9ZPG9_THETH|nr:class I SAM-dependent methyltransferase [Thermus thermophilus]AFH38229.1 methylase involved in ubiquinone/menaquinone biosynthesis [Thermus thermophilus JL-18]
MGSMGAKGGLRARFFAALLPTLSQGHAHVSEPWRRRLLGDLAGTVLEIGPGTGVNLAYLPDGVYWIGLEPNPYFHPHLRRALSLRGLSGDVLLGQAEAIPLPEGSVEAVVATLVLCSVEDPRRALAEILRVLKPEGRFVFLEHVAAPRGSGPRWAQDLLCPLWAFLGDGCHPNRETLALIREAGFARVEAASFALPLPLVAPHVAGVAWKE